jgi:hypothetical protein
MSRGVPPCAAALAVVGATGSSLVSSMETALGRRPRLEVASSSRGPAPTWAVPPLAPGADVLLRWTAYRVGDDELSRHVAVIQLSVLGAVRAKDLQQGRVTLADLLTQPGVERSGIQVGLLGQDVIVEAAVHRAFMADGGSGSLACRRYHVTVDGAPAGVVVEVLRCETWERMVASNKTQEVRSRP